LDDGGHPEKISYGWWKRYQFFFALGVEDQVSVSGHVAGVYEGQEDRVI